MNKEIMPVQKIISREPFPSSEKVYIKGKIHDIKVAMRKITLTDTKTGGKALENNLHVFCL